MFFQPGHYVESLMKFLKICFFFPKSEILKIEQTFRNPPSHTIHTQTHTHSPTSSVSPPLVVQYSHSGAILTKGVGESRNNVTTGGGMRKHWGSEHTAVDECMKSVRNFKVKAIVPPCIEVEKKVCRLFKKLHGDRFANGSTERVEEEG